MLAENLNISRRDLFYRLFFFAVNESQFCDRKKRPLYNKRDETASDTLAVTGARFFFLLEFFFRPPPSLQLL